MNVQHDCVACLCGLASENVCQEHLETTQQQQCVDHTGLQHYILNMHSLHNTALIRETLPRSLTQPKPYIPIENRRSSHDHSADALQISGPAAQAAAKLKAAATRARNNNLKAKKGKTKDVEGTADGSHRPGTLERDVAEGVSDNASEVVGSGSD